MSSTDRPAVERVQPPKRPYALINPVVRRLLSSPRGPSGLRRHLLILHVTGRTSGRRHAFPVAYRHLPDGRLLVLTSSSWRVNLRGRPNVEVTLEGVRRSAQAELVEEPEAVADVYGAVIAEVGHEKAGRRMGIRINVHRSPTREELVAAARRDGLSAVRLVVTDVAQR